MFYLNRRWGKFCAAHWLKFISRFFILFILCIHISAISHAAILKEKKEKVVFAMDIVRHGERTPLHELPHSTYVWSEGLGQLTPLGMQNAYQLGLAFRKKYIQQYHLLPARYQRDSLYASSTNYDRTLMTAECILLGLYPLGTGPLLPMRYQPIPIHPQPDPPKYNKNKIKKEIQKSYRLGDALYVYQANHIPLPENLSGEYAKKMIQIGHLARANIYKTPEIADRLGSFYIKLMKYYLKSAAESSKLKYVLLVAHDSTIMSIMTMLHAPLSEPPHYLSDINLLLIRNQAGDYFVKVLFNNKPVNLPNCRQNTCSLQQFMAI